ncbi:hypothetical protein SASPL_153104 [Salvia splendens]|uniref:Phosphoribosylformylglycinamidine synthase n=1 Tax=Salvia splendens TaxID=180675 RepID=A0A8X8W4Y7_SALSN|nr:hypothetical protein SASPL_153104 [Salvia splendens]
MFVVTCDYSSGTGAMAAAFEITAAGFYKYGAYRQKLALPKHSFRQANCLLWGRFPGKQPSVRISRAPRKVKVKAVLLKDVGHSGRTESELEHVQRVAAKVVHFYRVPLLQDNEAAELLKLIQSKVSNQIIGLKTEQCYNIGVDGDLPSDKHSVLRWLLGETFEPENLGTESFLDDEIRTNSSVVVVEVGPRLSFTTAWSSNAVSICRACGLTEISRLEWSRRYLLYLAPGSGSLVQSQINDLAALGRKALEEINEEMGLAFDEQDLQYYTKLFMDDIKRNPTNVELFDMAQSNSEHSRHWFFTGKIVVDGEPMDKTLMQIVKSTLQANPSNSVIGFKDNSSAIRGFPVDELRPTNPGLACPLDMSARDLDILFTAETHNFPCAVAPYPGAETGAGGRIRDTHATGSYTPWEDQSFTYPSNLASLLKILIDASNGASDYGNKFGEPLIQGYTRTFGMRLPNGERREWLKPIMFSAGIGQIDHSHISKGEPEIGMLVVKVGGPAYCIGMGGGAASSMVSGQNDAELDFNGAGGNCNVVKEIIYPKGATIDIRAVVVGDYTMSVLEIWGAEYQEQDAILVNPESRDILQSICKRERVSMAVLGTISGEGRITLVDGLAMEKCNSNGLPPPLPAVDLELEKVLGDMPQKTFEFHRVANAPQPLDIAPGITVMESLKRVLRLPSIASKPFLTTKVDSNFSKLYWHYWRGLLNWGAANQRSSESRSYARLAIGEALTNLVWARVTSLSDVKASGNWMYAAKLDGEGAAMYDAAIALSEAMIELGIAIDGGKDSLSMAAHSSEEVVKAPGNLVISTYVTCPDITKTVTPDLKLGDDGLLLHIDLAKGKRRFGGSALAQVYCQVGDECPDLDDVSYLKSVFNAVQNLIEEGLISAGHDISDGGLLLGVIIEVSKKDVGVVTEKLVGAGVSSLIIGKVTSSPIVELKIGGISQLTEKTSELRDLWEETSFELEKLQRLASCVELEKDGLKSCHEPSWRLSFTPSYTDEKYMNATSKPKVAIIREEGSNGDREMSAAFFAAGFEPWDVTMSDLLNGGISLHDFRGIAFVGGFSYADVLDSAKGWAASIRFNKPLLAQFQEFYERPDTFSLGVCNGCQLMALSGWVPCPKVGGVVGDNGDPSQPRFIHNESGRFNRFSSVKIENSPALMFKGMEGSTLGVWAAHGEGRAYFPDDDVFNSVLKSSLVPVKYCDDDEKPTEVYPFNVNGSPLDVAAICSPDGRHLAMMPHPERCFLMWQYPWYPTSWDVDKKGPSPWLRMFQNAQEWCS